MFKFFGIGKDEDEMDDDLQVLDSEFEPGDPENEVGQIALDIIEKNDKIVIVAPIAGIDLEDVDLSIKKNVLIISGNRKKPDDYYNGGILRNIECYWGNFVRNIVLPENINFDEIKAIMDNNILVINIPKVNLDTKNIKIDRVIS